MKVFLIDDLKVTNLVNKRYLSQIKADLFIWDFEDPKLAMASLLIESPDLVFLDLHMPEISGWDVLEYMNMECLNIPVIILTSSDSPSDREKARTFPQVISFQLKPLSKAGFEILMQEASKMGGGEIKPIPIPGL